MHFPASPCWHLCSFYSFGLKSCKCDSGFIRIFSGYKETLPWQQQKCLTSSLWQLCIAAILCITLCKGHLETKKCIDITSIQCSLLFTWHCGICSVGQGVLWSDFGFVKQLTLRAAHQPNGTTERFMSCTYSSFTGAVSSVWSKFKRLAVGAAHTFRSF